MIFFHRSALILLLLFSIAVTLTAQIVPKDENYALIFPKSGDGFAANILRVEKDSLIVFTNDFKYIAKKDIGRIVLHSRSEYGKGFVIGSILGVYASNYFLGTANGQPGGFLWDRLYGSRYASGSYSESPLSAVGIVLIGVAAGGGIGYLTD